MTERRLNLLVDTNVWLDHFLGRKNAPAATAFLQAAFEREDALAVTPAIMKDAFFIVGTTMKRRARESGGGVDAAMAAAANEAAWSCLSSIQSQAAVLSIGFGEHLEATMLRGRHADYEDDLLLAVAQKDAIDYLVTNDQKLLAVTAAPAMMPQEYLASFALHHEGGSPLP